MFLVVAMGDTYRRCAGQRRGIGKDLDQDEVTGSVATSISGRAGNTEGVNAGAEGQLVGVARPHSAFVVGKADYTALTGGVQTAKSFLHLRYAYEARRHAIPREVTGAGPESALDLAVRAHLGMKLSCAFRYDSRPPTAVKTSDVEVKNSLPGRSEPTGERHAPC